MKSILIALLTLICATTALTKTMTCTGIVYRAEDFSQSNQGKDDISQKIAKDFSINITGDQTEYSADATVNGINVTMVLYPLGLSNSYNFVFDYNTGVEGRPNYEARINDVLYFLKTEDGKPGTHSGDWPFPGENLGDVYRYNTFNGGALGLTKNTVQALKKANLFEVNRYFYVDSLNKVLQLSKDIPTLKKMGLIKNSDVVALGTFDNCYLK